MIIESAEESQKSMLAKLREYLSGSEAQVQLTRIAAGAADPVFVVSLDALRRRDSELVRDFLHTPTVYVPALERELQEALRNDGYGRVEATGARLRVDFSGSFGRHTVTPRGLKAHLVNRLVRVCGIITSATNVRSRLLKSTHFCAKTNRFVTHAYSDALGLRLGESRAMELRAMPETDEQDNPLTFEHGLSLYKDVQVLTLQDTPESVPAGLLSRSVEAVLQEGLVDAAKPGDRVEVVGLLTPLAGASTLDSGVFRTMLVTFSVQVLSRPDEQLTPAELREAREIAKRPDLVQLLCRSFAPAICGHDPVKEGLVLQLLGGAEKNLPTGTRLRGDINVLLVGDPSTAKSQFLRRVMAVSPLGFTTNGKGSTGVGLTAAISHDRDTGERRLEAGAMVLADRGVICVDEFDKMNEIDRVAMHEAMEQQTVTLAKAGVHVSLNARCSILAAANPVYGHYIKSLPHARNIAIVESLLSRFDLIFIVLDEKDPTRDRLVSERVTANHRFQGGPVQPFAASDSGAAMVLEQARGSQGVYEHFNPLMHPDRRTDFLTQSFFRKYIAYCKSRDAPELSEEAANFIRRHWSTLRQLDYSLSQREKLSHIVPVTIRSLESLIRLSTAYARMRLAPRVELRDCTRAFLIFITAFFGGDANPRFAELSEEIKASDPSLATPARAERPRRGRETPAHSAVGGSEKPSLRKKQLDPVPETRSTDEYKEVFRVLIGLAEGSSSVSIDELWARIRSLSAANQFGASVQSESDLVRVLNRLSADAKIQLEKRMIYIV